MASSLSRTNRSVISSVQNVVDFIHSEIRSIERVLSAEENINEETINEMRKKIEVLKENLERIVVTVDAATSDGLNNLLNRISLSVDQHATHKKKH